jgi:hypothetical protein
MLPTLLKVTNKKVQEINSEQLQLLDGPICLFSCLDGSQRSGDDPCTPTTDARHVRACNAFYEHSVAESEICFKVGAQVVHFIIFLQKLVRNKVSVAQVMLIYNVDRSDVPSHTRLVNGSRGIVVELVSYETCQRELEQEDRRARDAIAPPAAALGSRGNAAISFNTTRLSVLKQYCDRLRINMGDEEWTKKKDSLRFPRVRFINGVCKVVAPSCFSQRLYNGGYVFRLQLPIKCGFPISD